MAVLQYVGARYVPKLFNDGKGGMEWQAGTYYEPLTIVTYNNASYISRGPVAASIGNPAVNGEYWAETGNYNGYVAELSKRIGDVESEVVKLKASTVLIIADSYGVSTAGNPNPWTQLIQTGIRNRGGICEIAAQGGSGFVGNGSVPTFQELLEAAPVNDYDLILVQGFTNDMPSGVLAQGFANACAQFRARANAKFPNAEIVCLPISKNINNSNVNVVRVMREAILRNYMAFHDTAWAYITRPEEVQSDNTHPNPTGSTVIFQGVWSYLSQGSFRKEGGVQGGYAFTYGDTYTVRLTGSQVLAAIKSAGGNFRESIEIPTYQAINASYNFIVYAFASNGVNEYLIRLYQTGKKLYALVVPFDSSITGAIDASFNLAMPNFIPVDGPVLNMVPG